MQCNQPVWCPGFPNSAQFPPYQIHPNNPEVIGEGDVIPFALPDGSVQYYFLPASRPQRWIPYSINSTPTLLPVWSNPNTEAWFIRSVLNTYPSASTNQYNTFNYESNPPRSVNLNAPGYVQKFHYDNWTSTTDLHYFYPRLRNDWLTRGCAAIQVEVPKEEGTIYHYGTVCNRPCHCSSNDKKNTETNNDKTCDGVPMCVDEIKSDSVNRCCCDEKNKEKPSRNCTSNNKINICGCHSRSKIKTADKLVTTYTDQGSSCFDIKGREKKKTRTRNSTRSSNRDVDACNSACCLGSPCSD